MIQNEVDLDIFQGADFIIELEHSNSDNTPLDITGALLRGQVRPSYTSQVKYDFVCEITNALLGKSKVTMPASSLLGIKLSETTKYVYDIELEMPSTQVIKVMLGKAFIYPESTK